jgi:hemerythrin-like domain-containing protein
MGIQIGAKPDSGFDDPIGMLKDCHRRIEQFLHILCLVAERAAGRTLTGEEISAIQASLHYFRTGGPRHTADEEQSLFPRLRAESTSDPFSDLARLEDDHHTADALHTQVDRLYTAWIADAELTPENQQALLTATRRLAGLYAAHIDVEESIVFPHAARTLSHATLTAIGEEFRSRRS